MPVAALAVMKAGGDMVALDVKQPAKRLIVAQTNSSLPSFLAHMRKLGSHDWQRKGGSCRRPPGPGMAPGAGARRPGPARRQPPQLALRRLHLGHHGKPRGRFDHAPQLLQPYCTSAAAFGLRSALPRHGFASYAFDAAWANLFNALTSRACLCIPPPDERENGLAVCLVKCNVSLIDLTSSLARSMGVAALSSLKMMVLGGKASLSRDALLVGKQTRIVSAYGPAECTPTSHLTKLREDAVSIDHGAGVCTWILDPNDIQKLLPLRSVGELWI